MIIIILSIIISIAFVTLLERKILGIIQKRIGPNVIGWYGLLQPFMDGIKLILNESILPNKINKLEFIITPIFLLYLTLILWIVIPFDINTYIFNKNYDLLYIFAISSLTIYGILFGGFFSKSKYSFISAIRSTTQLISYEISLGLLLLPIIIINSTLNTYNIYFNQILYKNYYINIINLVLLFIIILAETNRTPFDLLEAESELVSGYLTEYSSIIFVFFYLAEYSMILFWSYLTYILFNIHYVIILFLIIIIRAILPRFKYNLLLILGWYIILPIAIINLLINILIIYII